MRERISKAKAFIAVRNYNAAIYELENIRRETSDASVQSVANVLLVNGYLEQGDYKRAQDFLNLHFNDQKTTKPNASANYASVAGQIIKGSRNQVERYRGLGLSVTDRNLPLEAVNDIERMRETLELVVTQAKEIGKDKQKSAVAIALLEEASKSRSIIARDDYDAKRWKDEAADSREQMASSQSVIINAVDGSTEAAVPPETATVAISPGVSAPVLPAPQMPEIKSVTAEEKPKLLETGLASNNKPVVETPKNPEEKPIERTRVIAGVPQAETAANKEPTARSTVPLDVGSLVGYATRQSSPAYPAAARTTRATGVVKVEVTVDEQGNVAEVQKATGPSLLQASAKDAIRKWKFKPFVVDGQPVKATGFVNFNFSL